MDFSQIERRLSPKLQIQKKPVTDEQVAMTEAHTALMKIREYINARVFEREAETDSAIISVLSGASCFFLGDAGAGKTMHVEILCSLTGLSLFNTLISETTKPESIFGQVDVPALAQGIQRIKTKGYAPSSEVLFFDEIFKGSDVILNPLLGILNEHTFRNGDEGVIQCPIVTVFAASNEIPTDKGSRPIYDRFLIRHDVAYIKSNENLHLLFKSVMKAHKLKRPEPMTREQIFLLRDTVSRVKVSSDIWATVIKIRDAVKAGVGVVISDRRMVKVIRVVQASALLHRRSKVDLSDLEMLAHMFWDQPEQIRRVRGIVMAHCSSVSGDLASYSELAENIYNASVTTGEIKEGYGKLEDILTTTKTFDTQNGIAIHRTVLSYAQRLEALIESRATFHAVVMRDENGAEYYKLSEASAAVWTKKEIRSVGFRLYRALDYWWYDAAPKKSEATLRDACEKVLESELKLTRMVGV